jgi:hypothetical protein
VSTVQLSPILKAPAWPALRRRLERALAEDGRLAMARDVLLRPLELLDLMAQEAPGALGDDVIKAERLRLMLQLALPFGALVREARELGGKSADGQPDSASAYRPGIIDHGALVIVALAAVRVAPPRMPAVFLQVVHGVALAAAPAEVLGRLGADQPDAGGLGVILRTLYLLDTVGAALSTPFLRPFATDPYERDRWRCLARLLEHDVFRTAVEDAARGVWDGATAAGIGSVQPIDAVPGDVVVVSGDLKSRGRGLQPRRAMQPVFAAPQSAPLPAKLFAWRNTPRGFELRLTVPAEATAGWIGWSDDELIASSNQYRRGLRRAFLDAFADEPSLRGSDVPAGAIPLLERPDPRRPGHFLAVPPRTAGNVFLGGRPRITDYDQPTATADGTLVFSWESVAADYVRLDPAGTVLPPSGEARLAAPTGGAETMQLVPGRRVKRGDVLGSPVTIVASAADRIRIVQVDVHQGARRGVLYLGQPLDVDVRLYPPAMAPEVFSALILGDGKPPIAPARPPSSSDPVSFVIAPERLHDGLTFTVAVSAKAEARAVAEKRVGPLRLASPRSVSVVLVRPALLEPDRPPVPLEAARAALDRAGAASGVIVSTIDLPWLEDPLAVLVGRPSSPDEPRVDVLLEHLARRALLTSGHEDALWLLLLPGGPSPTLSRAAAAPVPSRMVRHAPAVAARAVAVSDEAGLPELLAAVFTATAAKGDRPVAAPTARLRILGVVHLKHVEISSVREEARGAGPGAPVKTKITAVALGRTGAELAAHPVKVMRQARPTLLGLLVPVSVDVAAIELRCSGRVLVRLERPAHAPILRKVAVDATNALTWSYRHPDGGRPQVSVALRNSEITTTVLIADECAPSEILPLWRFRAPAQLVVAASDGWNAVEEAVQPPTPAAGPALIRRLSDGRFWADVPERWQVAWLLEDGEPLGKTRLLEAPPVRRTTRLVLRAIPPDGETPVVDEVTLAATAL